MSQPLNNTNTTITNPKYEKICDCFSRIIAPDVFNSKEFQEALFHTYKDNDHGFRYLTPEEIEEYEMF
jgi:hypothetical protein